MVPISQRPDGVLDRTVPGHWEGDLLVGRYGRSHMVTLVERHSRYLLVLPLLDATTRTVVAALMAAFQQLPPTMRRSLTWDRGGNDPPRRLHRCDRHPGLLLRRLLPLAARQQREQQRSAAAVLSE
jgi:hypothetical protein